MATNRTSKDLKPATLTRMQELGTAWIFKRAIQHNKTWNTYKDIMKDKKTFPELQKIWSKVGGVEWDDDVDDAWLESFYKQQHALIKKIGKPAFTLYTRDGAKQNSDLFPWQKKGGSETFMEWIENFLKKDSGFRIDIQNWSPADIWLIRNEKKHKDALEAAFKRGLFSGRMTEAVLDSNLKQFNAYMRGLYVRKQIMGISLKKIGKGAAIYKEVNVTSAFFKKQRAIEMTYVGARCSLGTKAIDRKAAEKNRGKNPFATLETQDARIFIQHGTDKYEIQIKGNSSTKMDNLKFEPTQTNRGAAKMGKATREFVIDTMRAYRFGNLFSHRWQDYPQKRDQKKKRNLNDPKEFAGFDPRTKGTSGHYGEQKKYYDMITELGDEVDWGGVTPEVGIVNINETFGLQRNQAWVANAKCQEITWLYYFLSTLKTQKDRNKFVTDLIFLAAKEGKSMDTRYGPFGKIY